MKNEQTLNSEANEKVAASGTTSVVSAPSRTYLFFKRALDIFVSVLGLLLCLLPMAFISLAICIDSRGGVFFRQERLGKGGKAFRIVKFRSMYLDAEVFGPKWAEKNDERCTKVGRFLRRSRLDELPQFWNILVGDMSLVGPRPERAYFYDEFEKTIPNFRDRLLVTPGLTGVAQINGGYDLKPEEKLAYDLEYIRTQSMKTDLRCIFKTVSLVFTGEGAR